ncbi:MAG TPA: HD domain-containing phosphohydrolase [Candidatus Acidoferrales bacterium]|jgi:putative nucleotidyltransferase with HDIG domain|nr:HD domain-containing phosphohydrolase [Candidatus Acidoferrales bacterium]
MQDHQTAAFLVLGTQLSCDRDALIRKATLDVRLSEAIPTHELDEAVEALVDAYTLSLTFGRPTGVSGWAERYACEFGRVGALGVAAAVSRTIATAAADYDMDRPRLLAFLRTVDADVSRCALEPGMAPENPAAKTAEVLLAMLAARDAQAVAHARAVASWSRRLSAKLELSREATEFVSLCALLHDVGTVSTPEAILHRRGALSGVETAIVRDHAAAGERILRGIPELERCADVVRSHHERWDGTGYPDRLSGTSIPIEARIIAVADGFHAMISERPQRLPITPRIALDIVAGGRGTQWDPSIVDALHAMFRHARSEPARQTVSSA